MDMSRDFSIPIPLDGFLAPWLTRAAATTATAATAATAAGPKRGTR